MELFGLIVALTFIALSQLVMYFLYRGSYKGASLLSGELERKTCILTMKAFHMLKKTGCFLKVNRGDMKKDVLSVVLFFFLQPAMIVNGYDVDKIAQVLKSVFQYFNFGEVEIKAIQSQIKYYCSLCQVANREEIGRTVFEVINRLLYLSEKKNSWAFGKEVPMNIDLVMNYHLRTTIMDMLEMLVSETKKIKRDSLCR